jgi:hypothetical protein
MAIEAPPQVTLAAVAANRAAQEHTRADQQQRTISATRFNGLTRSLSDIRPSSAPAEPASPTTPRTPDDAAAQPPSDGAPDVEIAPRDFLKNTRIIQPDEAPTHANGNGSDPATNHDDAPTHKNGAHRSEPQATPPVAPTPQPAHGRYPLEDEIHEPAPFALVGMVCGRYRLEAPLGRGGLGEVYRARDLQFDRTVAVKVIYEDRLEGADAFDSLMREVSLVDRITHPNVVRVYDVIRFEGRVAIVMEYVQGQSLSAIARERGLVSPGEFDAVLTGIAEALDAAHAAGVVHGDVTPGNVLITADGKVKLCDFGVGRLVGDDPTAPRAGTPRFVAPEVLEGRPAGPRSDIFSLGALTVMMIAGRDADSSDLPDPFSTVVKSALEPDPEMRCSTAGALASAFHAAAEENFLEARSPIRRLMDNLRAKLHKEPPAVVDLPPTVSFPLLDEEKPYVPDDPDRTRPLPPPSMRPGGEVTQPLHGGER